MVSLCPPVGFNKHNLQSARIRFFKIKIRMRLFKLHFVCLKMLQSCRLHQTKLQRAPTKEWRSSARRTHFRLLFLFGSTTASEWIQPQVKSRPSHFIFSNNLKNDAFRQLLCRSSHLHRQFTAAERRLPVLDRTQRFSSFRDWFGNLHLPCKQLSGKPERSCRTHRKKYKSRFIYFILF